MWHVWGAGRCIQAFGWRPEGRKAPRRRRHRWEDNINMDVEEIAWNDPAHDRAR